MRASFFIVTLFLCSVIYSQKNIQDYSFKSENNKFTLKAIQIQYDTILINFGKGGKRIGLSPSEIKWGLYRSSDDSLIYSFNHLELHKMAPLITNDGENIVLLNEKISYRKLDRSTLALELFSNGKLVKEHKLKNIINVKNQLIKIDGNGHWCLEDFKVIDDSIFEVTTVELKSIKFNLSTGKIISSEYINGVNQNTVILYGDVDRDFQDVNTYTIHVDYIIQGPKLKYYDYDFEFYSDKEIDGICTLIAINDHQYDPVLNDLQFGLKK